MLNQSTRKLELSRREMLDIQRAIGATVRRCEHGTKTRAFWEDLYAKVKMQLEMQDNSENENEIGI